MSGSRGEVADLPQADAGPLIRMQLSLGSLPWRIAPAWATVAGAIAGGAALFDPADLFRVGAAVALADPAMGLLRQFAAPAAQTASSEDVPVLLPYMQPDAPLGRLMRGLASRFTGTAGAARSAWQALVLGLGLVFLLGLLLGPAALVVLPIALLVILLAALLAQRGRRPALCYALLDVALPWALGAGVVAASGAGGMASVRWDGPAVAAGFTALQWGVWRARLSAGKRIGVVWLGSTAVVAALVVLGMPLVLLAVTPLLAAAAWRLRRAGSPTAGDLAWAMPCWWAAMLLCAAAVR